MTTLLADLKHGIRVLARAPLFTLCTIAALAIGIGSTDGHNALSGASSCCSKPQPPVPSVAMHAKSLALVFGSSPAR